MADIVLGLPFDHYPYHAIIDKGTLDCTLCRPTGKKDAGKAIMNMHANLKNPGTLVMFSHAPPSMRLPLLQEAEWESIQVKVILPADWTQMAEGASEMVLREYSVQVMAPEQSSYVYICKKPY
eukprot:GHRR01023687.1.p1 GENE.GHRR01023687.1~~GHRR01023687.1.p1  ORF type:complete len:123 (+),score=32.22 GHRR01023687.1:1229-1597(+)